MSFEKVDSIPSEENWREIIGKVIRGRMVWNSHKFKAHLGVTFSTLRLIWFYLAIFLNNNRYEFQLKPIYLIWALIFLKVYPTWDVMTSLCVAEKKTIQKWVWIIIKMIPMLMRVSNMNLKK